MRIRAMAAVVAAIVCVAFTASAGAQRRTARDADDPDMKEVESYRLTVPVLQKVAVATDAMVKAMQNDPKFRGYFAAKKELDALDKKDELSDADQRRKEQLEKQVEQMEQSLNVAADDNDVETLSDMERTMAKIPHFADALAAAGLSGREFAKFELSALQASLAVALEKTPGAKRPAGVLAENVAFVKAHEAEITKINEAMQGVGK